MTFTPISKESTVANTFTPALFNSNNYFMRRYRSPLIVLISTVVVGIFIYLARRLHQHFNKPKPLAPTYIKMLPAPFPKPQKAPGEGTIAEIAPQDATIEQRDEHPPRKIDKNLLKILSVATKLCSRADTTRKLLSLVRNTGEAVRIEQLQKKILQNTTTFLSIETYSGHKILAKRYLKNCLASAIIQDLISNGHFTGYNPHQLELVHGEEVIPYSSRLPEEITLQKGGVTIRIRIKTFITQEMLDLHTDHPEVPLFSFRRNGECCHLIGVHGIKSVTLPTRTTIKDDWIIFSKGTTQMERYPIIMAWNKELHSWQPSKLKSTFPNNIPETNVCEFLREKGCYQNDSHIAIPGKINGKNADFYWPSIPFTPNLTKQAFFTFIRKCNVYFLPIRATTNRANPSECLNLWNQSATIRNAIFDMRFGPGWTLDFVPL